jgi:hypothetical protein
MRLSSIFEGRGSHTELKKSQLTEMRLRFILLNLVYVDQMGGSAFNIKYKGNEPHVDHIYPRHATANKLGLWSSEVNHLGNYRFVGATDNIRKRGELPDSYFARLRKSGVDIGKHLLLEDVSSDPSKLKFDPQTSRDFRDRRLDAIWQIAGATVNPENPPSG